VVFFPKQILPEGEPIYINKKSEKFT